MSLKPLEPKQSSAASQQQGLERAGNHASGITDYSQTPLQPVTANAIPGTTQVNKVQGATQSLVSPSANEKALAHYGVAFHRLRSGKSHGRTVAGYAEIPSLNQWWQSYQTRSTPPTTPTRSAAQANSLTPAVRKNPTESLAANRNEHGASSLKGGHGRFIQIKV